MSWDRWHVNALRSFDALVAARKSTGMAAVFGLVIFGAVQPSPWLIVPAAVVLSLLYRSSIKTAQIESMRSTIDQLSALSRATPIDPADGGRDRFDREIDLIERVLVQAVAAVGGCRSVGVARPMDAHRPETSPLQWTGTIEPEVRAEFGTVEELGNLDDTGAGPAGAGGPNIRVWPLDPVTLRHLVVVAAGRTSLFRNLWDRLEQLVDSARHAIANTHEKGELADAAELEFVRARTDESTGLPNAFAARGELERRLEDGIGAPLGVVAVALLGYKQLVDVLGKERGDEAIAAFAHRLRRLDGVEYLARINPAEFVFFATGSADELVELADRARRVDSRDQDSEVDLRDASAAIAIAYPDQPISSTDLLSRVDLALEQADASGDVAVFGEAELANEQRRVDIRLRLSDALANRELWPAFQPQLDLRTGAVAGLEVLARWSCPELGSVAPGEFIAVAEQSNQIKRLTVSMLEQALDAHRVWAAQGATFPIAVNLSARTLARPRFLALLVDIVKQSGLPAEMLTLEITESTLVNGEATIAALTKLSDLGTRISIDDFGTGYSSLSYLERLPIHELKIDRSMVAPLETYNSISPVIRWLTRMCQDLGYLVVAEGVETQRQLRALQNLEVDVGQGYCFARPMPATETTDWLAAYRPSEPLFGQRAA